MIDIPDIQLVEAAQVLADGFTRGCLILLVGMVGAAVIRAMR